MRRRARPTWANLPGSNSGVYRKTLELTPEEQKILAETAAQDSEADLAEQKALWDWFLSESLEGSDEAAQRLTLMDALAAAQREPTPAEQALTAPLAQSEPNAALPTIATPETATPETAAADPVSLAGGEPTAAPQADGWDLSTLGDDAPKRFTADPDEVARLLREATVGGDPGSVTFMEDTADPKPAEAETMVVAEDTVLIQVTDENGKPKNGVTVTLSWMENGVPKTRTGQTAKLGTKDGYLAIDEMKGEREGTIDVSCDGYRLITVLNRDISGDTVHKIQLIPTTDGDIYLRALDFGGVNLLDGDMVLSLATCATDPYAVTAIVARTGGWGSRPILCLEDTHRDSAAGVKYFTADKDWWYLDQTDSAIFTFTKRWSEIFNGNHRILTEGDTLSVVLQDPATKEYSLVSKLDNFSVEDSPVGEPISNQFSFDLFGMNGSVARIGDDIPVMGGTEISCDLFKIDVILTYDLKGDGIFGYGRNLFSALAEKEVGKSLARPGVEKRVKTMEERLQKTS